MKPIEIDVFNGDADGLFAAHQLRLAEPGADPGAVRVVTGLKREISLLEHIDAATRDGARLQLRVFDIALGRNRTALEKLLAAGATVRWFDHHHPGAIPEHPRLRAFIDTSPEVCTSLIVDRELRGAHRRWAVAAAFGDNLHAVVDDAEAAAGAVGTFLAGRGLAVERIAAVLPSMEDVFVSLIELEDRRREQEAQP